MSTTAVFPLTIKGLPTPFPVSPDTGFTIWGMRRKGESVFAGARNAKVIFWEGSSPPDGRSVQDWQKDGYFPINCEGAYLDHHPHNQHEGECAFTLLLYYLGLQDDPRYLKMKQYVLWDDTRHKSARPGRPEQQASIFTVGRLFKDMQEGMVFTGDKAADDKAMHVIAERALAWLFEALDCHLRTQELFFTAGKQAYDAAQQYEFASADGQVWNVIVGKTDCNQFSPYARSPYAEEPRADLMIQKRSSGQVQIVANSNSNLKMDGLPRLVRMMELSFRGLPSSTASGDELEKEGRLPAVPWWYYMRAQTRDGASMLLNGSPRHRSVPPTAIPLSNLVRLVQLWLATQPTGRRS